jgi:hypothetical protein
MKNKGFIKFIFFSALMITYNAVVQTEAPIIANKLAMQQMQNYDTSSMGIQLYQYVINNSWIIFVLLFITLFRPEIVKLIKTLKEKNNEEK